MFDKRMQAAQRSVLLTGMLLSVSVCGREGADGEHAVRSELEGLDSLVALEGQMVSVFDTAPAVRSDIPVTPDGTQDHSDPALAPPGTLPGELPNPTERVREALPTREEREARVPRATAPAPSVAPAAEPARANEDGLRLFARRNYAESARRFAEAVAAAPNHAAYRNNYGWALFKAGNVAEAERELLEVLRLNPNREIAYANLGEVRLARGDVVGGAAAYQRFLELNNNPVRQRIAQEKLGTIRQR
jgi:hypothetical protein